MAYGVKYRAEWRATTRGVRDYVVEILKDGYTGSISPLYLTGDCITITYGEVDQSELQPIKSSEAEITALCMEDNNPYMELYTLTPAEYQVVIYENDNVIWRGYLATGDYTQPLAKAPYVVRFRANDGLAVLKAMPYLDSNGDRFTENRSVAQLFRSLLEPISDRVDIWNYALLRPDQTSGTFDILSIPEVSIYSVFGDNIPTYYDVLEAVLSNFGVQLFQQNDGWCIRSLDTLTNAVNSNLISVISIDNPSSYGHGLKTDAVLSFLPPIGKMTAPEEGSSSSVDITDILSQSSNWQARTGRASYRPHIYSYGKAIKIDASAYEYTSYIYGSASMLLPYIFSRSNNSKITISLDIFNGRDKDADGVYVGVWLRKPHSSSNEVATWAEDASYYSSQVSFHSTTCYWEEDTSDASKSKWVILKGPITDPTPSALGLRHVEIKKSPILGSRPAVASLSKTSVTFELPQIPEFADGLVAASVWQLAIVVAVTGDAPRRIYISNPQVSISTGEDAITTDIVISKDAIANESYDGKWRTSASGTSISTLSPMLADLSREGQRAHSYVTPSNEIADKDVVGRMLYQLRNVTSYTIDGELDDSRVVGGLNNVLSYDGKKYYTNYIKRLIKRGVSTVQLRELTSLRKSSWTWSKSILLNYAPRVISGVNNSLFFIDKSKNFGIADIYANITTNIRVVSTATTIRNGVDCIVLSDSSNGYVAAYDDNGKKLSEITNFGDNAVTAEQFYDTAKYDASRQIWLASDKGLNVVMCDQEGFVVDRWQCASPASSSQISDTEILPYHGGFVYRLCSTAESKYYCYWHCYSIHQAGTFEGKNIATPNGEMNIRILSDKILVTLGSNGRYTVSYINGVDLTDDAYPLVTLATTKEVLVANNAILVIRGKDSISIYDCRNTNGREYSLSTNPSMVALCGDYLVSSPTGTATNYSVRKIMPKINSINSIAVADE